MLKNIAISVGILESLGFKSVPLERGIKRTLMKHGDNTAEVLANGAVVINDKYRTDFKSVKRKKITGFNQ